MFEDSTFESGHRIKSRSGQWMTFTGLLNGAMLVLLILVPLIYPEALPSVSMMTALMTPPTPPPAQTAPRPEPRVARVSSEMMDTQLMAPPRIPTKILMVDRTEPPQADSVTTAELGEGNANAVDVFRGADAQGPRVQAAPQKQLAISSGVAAGMVTRKTIPVYPAVARAAHISGTVVLAATIGKSGAIENLRVVSGPPLLQGAAVDAVRTWLYRPYLLNGQPVGVETTVEVTFTLGG